LTENNTQEAQDLASKAGVQTKQAGRQAKAAARTGGKAVKAAAEPVVEEARDTANKFEGTAEDAVEAARKVNLGVLSRMSSDTGVGFLALSVAIYSGAVAYYKFRQAASGRSQVIS
jgi:ATP phosphoribosyltransferase regulatory subunit HisZ